MSLYLLKSSAIYEVRVVSKEGSPFVLPRASCLYGVFINGELK
jgi:hypothetical protein